MISPSIFRAYDIRGIVGEALTEETVFLIGKALGSYAMLQGEREMYVARDGRLSGDMLMAALTRGILATGCHVVQLGCVPTPVLYYAASRLGLGSGVMLTGSHNPAHYNGLKMVVKGITLAEEAIQSLYQRILRDDFVEGVGLLSQLDLEEEYLSKITQDIQLKRPLRIVIDAGNGVTGQLAPRVFRALGCDVTELFCEIDGSFPNHHPDPSEIKNLQTLIETVKATKADIGLAFDGDGDRLGVVTNTGDIIWPDRLLILFAEAMLAVRPAATVIYDVKCTHHLEPRIQQAGGVPLMWKTGHSLIKTKMLEIGALLAGEMSGHFFFKDRWNGFDDAIYAGARLLEILAAQPKDAHQLFQAIPNSVCTPELKIAVDDEEKFSIMQELVRMVAFPEAVSIATIDGIRVNFDGGWGLLRPSNTTPYLVARFEAADEPAMKSIQEAFTVWIQSINKALVLPF